MKPLKYIPHHLTLQRFSDFMSLDDVGVKSCQQEQVSAFGLILKSEFQSRNVLDATFGLSVRLGFCGFGPGGAF